MLKLFAVWENMSVVDLLLEHGIDVKQFEDLMTKSGQGEDVRYIVGKTVSE